MKKRVKKALPSGDAAIDLVEKPSPISLAKVIGTMAVRGLLVGSGLYLAGSRGKALAVQTLAATGAIEAGVLAWAAYHAK